VQSDDTAAAYTGQVTLKGYDNMTGLGTPDGQSFINALRATEKSRPPATPKDTWSSPAPSP
jgi:hypothetical protein